VEQELQEDDMKQVWLLLALALVGMNASAAIQGEPVEYKANGTVLKGYIAFDDSIKGKRPGVLVVHEWWGHNEYARKRARMLAELGYTALAVDMYGDGKQASHPDDAGKFSGEVMKTAGLAKKRFDAARKILEQHKTVDKKRIGAIGYCFGGGVVLHMARAGENLRGVVSFHGSLGTAQPAAKGKVKSKILVLTGADDPFVPGDQVDAFKKEMAAAGANYNVITYPGAKHAFTNPDADAVGQKFNMPLAYNAEVDKQSWNEMQSFFNRVLK
jgi:dienelactone hydrolase